MNKFPMHDATKRGDLEKVKQLIEAGVSVDSPNEQGQTPLHTAAFEGRYEVAALLINSNCDLDIKDRRGCTPMMSAAKHCNEYRSLRPRRMIDIVHLLLHRGAEVSCFDNDGCTLLHHACESGLTEAVRLILDSGEADLNASDQDGLTPLMTAAYRGHEEIVALLIRAGADVSRSYVRNLTVLHFAVYFNRARVLQILLEKEGLDLSPQDVDGITPLHLACLFGYRGVIKQLLDAGAATNLKNTDKDTALCVGIKDAKLTIEEIRLFLQKGAFLEKTSYNQILSNPFLREEFLKDVEFCTQSIVNKFHHQSLPALNSITYFARRLPNVDNFKLTARQIDEVKNLVKSEIERNTFCNVVKVHPISLSALCVLSLITCQSGKKRAASPDFGHSPFKKNS